MEIKTTWHAGHEKPAKSCQVICFIDDSYLATLDYSKRHEAFNACDFFDKKLVEKNRIDDIKAWAYREEIIEELRGALNVR